MSQREIILVAILSVTFVSQANAQSSEPSMLQYYAQLQNEQRKAEAVEQKTRNEKDRIERKKEDAERDVAERRSQIETLKAQQEKSRNELDQLGLSLKKVTSDIDSYRAEQKQLEQSAAETLRVLQVQRQEMLDRRTVLDQELRNLEAARRKAEREVYSIAVEIERYKVDIAKTETKIQEAQVRRAAVEADEAKIRADWTQAKTQIAEHKKAYDIALTDIAEAKKRYEGAARLLQEAKTELVRIEKARNDATKRAQDDIAKYERDIAAANKARLVAEAEQIRMETEINRVQEYSMKIKSMRDRNLDMQASAESMELRSSLAAEAARSAHSRSMETSDQAIFKKEKETQKTRSVAAAREAAVLDHAGRLFTTAGEGCQAYKEPNIKNKATFFEKDRKLLARESSKGWVEIMNGSGASVFIPSKCGSFEP